LALCCALAGGTWLWGQRREQTRQQALQHDLVLLGAPQGMEESPERWLLLGDFARGLRAEPGPETFEKLASLFLASHDLKGRKVLAMAHRDDLLARVVGSSLEFFDAKGEPLTPRLWTLKEQVSPRQEALFIPGKEPALLDEGAWLVYSDKQRWALFRLFGEELRGFVSADPLNVEEDLVKVDGQNRWQWSQGQLEPIKAP
jgi:hypothetical protein